MPIPQISPEELADRSFDYIIVGAGTAGLVIANRLTEDPSINVAVLEAGKSEAGLEAIDVPGRYGEGIGTEYDWQYETVPQPALRGRRLPWPRGKAVGGTSNLNFMVWNRPCKEDLDAWAELGNTGWAWHDLLPFYKRSENFSEPDASSQVQHKLFYDSGALGSGGPLSVSYIKEYSPGHELWHDTLNNLGIQTNGAHLSGSNVGAWTSVVAVDPKTATRSSAATSYFAPVSSRKNLTVLVNACAREIILEHDGQDWVARGVRFEHGTKEYTVTAKLEVIVSCGSVASPQLLELSGIGSPDVLKRAQIPVKVANANVGEHLQDHLMTATIFEIDPSIPTKDDLDVDSKLAAEADEMYRSTRQGPRTILPVSFAYVPLAHFVPADRLASMAQIASQSSTPRSLIQSRRLDRAEHLGQIEYIFNVGNWNPLSPSAPGKKYATMLQILQYPFSTGSIHIAANDPTGKPIIDPRYYDGLYGGLDLEVQVLCAGFNQTIVDAQPLKDFIRTRVWPPADATDVQVRDWIVDNTVTDWHPIGTCSMGGKEGIHGGVVDERLRVYGVKGLRVADASVMPLQISAHLQATVYAIGEKASHMIFVDRDKAHTNGSAS